jgi:lipopolysaccharide transport protein LptA
MIKNKKHNYKNIKIIKYYLVVVAVIAMLTMGYFTIINQNGKVNKKSQNENDSSKNIGFKVNSPDLMGINFDHGPYFIKSDDMEEIAGQISFVDPTVKMMLKHLDWFNLTAKLADLYTKDNHLELFKNVRANLNNQYFIETEQAEVIAKSSIIKSASYSKIYTGNTTLESDNGFVANYEDQTAFFAGKINTNIENEDHSITNIKSDKFDVFWLKKEGHFLGNVIMLREDTTVKANKMIALINGSSNRLEKIYLYGNIKIINDEQTSTSEYGEYVVATSILTLKDQVKLLKAGNTMSGEVLHYNFKTKKADLIGQKDHSKGAGNKRVRAVILPGSPGFKK